MSDRKLFTLNALAVAMVAVAIALTFANPAAPHVWFSAAIAGTTIAALLGVGIGAWRRGGETKRFGQVLFAAGVCAFLASMANADNEFLYSIGRVAEWIFVVTVIYALLSYPTGRLEGRAEPLIVGAAVLIVVVFYLPTIPLVHQYPLPTPLASCTSRCPGNFFFLGREPDFVDSGLRPVGDVMTLSAYFGVAVLLTLRLAAASHNLRRTLAPALWSAVVCFISAGLFVALRRAGAGEGAIDVAGFVALSAVPLTAVGFLVGIVRWRMYSATALSELTTHVSRLESPFALQPLLEQCLEDPGAELYYWLPEEADEGPTSWLNSSGSRQALPFQREETCVVEASDPGGSRVGFVCERSFRDYPEFLAAVASCLLSGLEQQRLNAALETSLAEIAASRNRLADAADDARRKIEQDLHDGAQQQLVTLRVKLELAREELRADSSGAAEVVGELTPKVDEIIEEVRSLARGIYPALLASGGLEEALRAAGTRSSLPVRVTSEGAGRLPADTERAVYFCCLEAMQNAAKHAEGASAVDIRLHLDGDMGFEVSDDGVGFESSNHHGSGLISMADRLAAVGGSLRIESSRGVGTRVIGQIPIN